MTAFSREVGGDSLLLRGGVDFRLCYPCCSCFGRGWVALLFS